MTFDMKVPASLKKVQQWFGSIIGRPIDEDSRMNPISPSGHPMELEAAEYISPSPALGPAQRIQIYNQQYWWRLLNTLHDSFSFVTRLFGYYDFNRMIGIPYITKYPPRHWSLNLLGDRLVHWLLEEYHAVDKELVLNAAKVDWAFSQSFFSHEIAPITADQLPSSENMNEIFCKQLYLQPHIHLFNMPYDIFSYRRTFIEKDPDYWMEHDFPNLESSKDYYHVLYRNKKSDVSWKEITFPEWHILQLFQFGATVECVCEWLEEQEDGLCEFVTAHLDIWFQEWTKRGWLSLEDA